MPHIGVQMCVRIWPEDVVAEDAVPKIRTTTMKIQIWMGLTWMMMIQSMMTLIWRRRNSGSNQNCALRVPKGRVEAGLRKWKMMWSPDALFMTMLGFQTKVWIS
ncbi:hypothetical protein CcCBS67573_g08568 [Chytriomyces confervae]|uniref:Uncharacterized protein n=1 Tax=Chytriomyces confervae TaxID=246404 RepID=A0A507EKU5_9FUNG|nr:hypothetical protein CcCBS67573_g08568 [Chytriomyces confervae]